MMICLGAVQFLPVICLWPFSGADKYINGLVLLLGFIQFTEDGKKFTGTSIWCVGYEINEIFLSFCIILCTSLIQMSCETAVYMYFVIMQINNWNKKLQMLIVL